MHYTYSSEHAPVATVHSGDTLFVEVQNGLGGNPVAIGETLANVQPELSDPVAGPIWVDGAKPGDTLAVTIDSVTITSPPVQGILPGIGVLEWPCTPLEQFGLVDHHVKWRDLNIEVHPMLGIVGVSPHTGAVPSVLCGDFGGNLDTKYVRAGAVVWLPVLTAGGGLVFGDGKALMGDGEVGGVSLQCDVDAVVTVILQSGSGLKRPRILCEDRLMFLGCAETVEQGGQLCVQDAVDFLAEHTRLTPTDAYFLVTMVGDLEVSQIVNELVTVRIAVPAQVLQQLDVPLRPQGLDPRATA